MEYSKCTQRKGFVFPTLCLYVFVLLALRNLNIKWYKHHVSAWKDKKKSITDPEYTVMLALIMVYIVNGL